MRDLVLGLVLGLLRSVVRTLSLVVPQNRSVVVSGFPATEGNAVETARALVSSYAGRVVWLQEGSAVPEEVRALVGQGLEVVAKASPRGILAYLRAEAVFFTHGLYGSPVPRDRKPVVNLWHGDGPKDIRPGQDTGALIASTYVVGSTQLFSEHKAAAFGVPPSRVLLTGNPRTDQLWRPPAPDQLARLGITGDFVLWLPTYRRARAVGAVRTRMGAAGPVDEARELTALRDGLHARGLQLVVKPHPIDADARRFPGAVTITDADLAAAGVSLCGVLGRARGVVTDYSSVWVDYLLLDRPIAFLVPDRDTYARRLLPADVIDWVPGEVVDAARAPFAEFFADLDVHGQAGRVRRAAVARRIGLNPTRTAAEDLVAALVERGVLRSRPETVDASAR